MGIKTEICTVRTIRRLCPRKAGRMRFAGSTYCGFLRKKKMVGGDVFKMVASMHYSLDTHSPQTHPQREERANPPLERSKSAPAQGSCNATSGCKLAPTQETLVGSETLHLHPPRVQKERPRSGGQAWSRSASVAPSALSDSCRKTARDFRVPTLFPSFPCSPLLVLVWSGASFS